MPKIPDLSKFDLQSIVNSVKTMINPEARTPDVEEGDPIGAKIVQISTLLQSVTHAQEQSAGDLTKVNSLLNELYKDLEQFRKREAELRQKQQAESQTVTSTVSGAAETHQTKPAGETLSTAQGIPKTPETSKVDEVSDKEVGKDVPPESKL